MIKPARKVPLRTCVVCGRKASKRELARIVASSDGAVQADLSGRLPGRGAYVCGDGGCLRGGVNRGRLERALRTRMKDEGWAEVMESVRAMVGLR